MNDGNILFGYFIFFYVYNHDASNDLKLPSTKQIYALFRHIKKPPH